MTWSSGCDSQLEWLSSRKELGSPSSRDSQGDRKQVMQSVLLRIEEAMGLSENLEGAARRRGHLGRKEV